MRNLYLSFGPSMRPAVSASSGRCMIGKHLSVESNRPSRFRIVGRVHVPVISASDQVRPWASYGHSSRDRIPYWGRKAIAQYSISAPVGQSLSIYQQTHSDYSFPSMLGALCRIGLKAFATSSCV